MTIGSQIVDPVNGNLYTVIATDGATATATVNSNPDRVVELTADDFEERCHVYDVARKITCGQPATRYMRVGDVVEHICESCYQRDIIHPGAHPASQAEYEAYQESDEDWDE